LQACNASIGETPCFRISAISGQGCRELTNKLQQALDMLPTAVVAPTIAGPECFSDESFNAQPRP
jgi:hypothetical protein